MANVQLSARVKKLAKDFDLIDGKIQLSEEKLNDWLDEFDQVPADERSKLGQELIALAVRFEREGKDTAALGVAQLYALAAGVLKFDGTLPVAKSKGSAGKAPAKAAANKPLTNRSAATKVSAPAAKPEKSSGGWGAKSKR